LSEYRYCFLSRSWWRYWYPDQQRRPSHVRRQKQW